MANQSTGVFYVETALDQSGEPLGEFRLVKNGCTYAYAKARPTLCALRDLLNAPRCLEGQTVEKWNGDRAVVQSVLDAGECVQVLVRSDDGRLDVWTVDGQLKVITIDQPSEASEVSP